MEAVVSLVGSAGVLLRLAVGGVLSSVSTTPKMATSSRFQPDRASVASVGPVPQRSDTVSCPDVEPEMSRLTSCQALSAISAPPLLQISVQSVPFVEISTVARSPAATFSQRQKRRCAAAKSLQFSAGVVRYWAEARLFS